MSEQPRFPRGITPTFQSAEQTGTGSPQNVAHGLARAPSQVWCVATSATATHFTIGTATLTNCVVTGVSSATFIVYATL